MKRPTLEKRVARLEKAMLRLLRYGREDRQVLGEALSTISSAGLALFLALRKYPGMQADGPPN